MAVGGEGPPLITAVIDDMTVGWTPFAPPFGTMWNPGGDVVYISGPVFKELRSLRWHDGVLARRQATRTIPVSDQPPVGYSESSLDESARYIFQLAFTPVEFSDTRDAVTVLVTDRDVYIEGNLQGGWLRVTPTYDEGNSEFTNATLTVMGTGTRYSAMNITPGQHIFNSAGSEWLEIAAILNDTTLTTVQPASGSTGGPGPQTLINRNFVPTNSAGNASDFRSMIFARLFNGDLYVAGNGIGGLEQPAVLKIRDILVRTSAPGFPTDPTVTNYQMATVELEEDMPGNGSIIDTVLGINGLDVLQDGRISVLTQETSDTSGSPVVGDRVSRYRYSSNLDQQQWFTAPGGFTDVVAGGVGVMTALGRLGRLSTIHYHDAISLGQPTGQADPPLNFDVSRAELGSAFPRTNKQIAGREWFVGYDGSIYTFNGSTIEMITDQFRDDWQITRTFEERIEPHAFIDTLRQEYFVARFNTSVGLEPIAVVNYRTGQVREEGYTDDLPFTAASDFLVSDLAAGGASATRRSGTRVVGTKVTHPGSGTAADDFLFQLSEFLNQDEVAAPIFASIFFETHPLDFGMPGVHKVIERVILWFDEQIQVAGPTPNTVNVTIFPETLTGQETVSRTLEFNAARQEPYHFEFNENRSAENWQIRITFDDQIYSGGLGKMAVRYQPLNEDEALENKF